jgi:hypothetical protein
MLEKLSRAVDELQSSQNPKSGILSDLRAAAGWLAQHTAVIALLVATCGAVLYGSAYLGYRIGESKAEAYKLFDELDLKTTAAFAKQASVDLGFASARFADMLKRTKSLGELQEANAKLEASHKELQKRIADLTLDADIAKKERDKLQAFIDRTRRADQTKK